MAFLPGIFGQKQQPQQQPPQQQQAPAQTAATQQQPQNSTYSQGPGNQGWGGTSGQQQPQQQQPPGSPLDSFMQLMIPKDQNAQQKPAAPEGLFGNMNSESIRTHAKSANFADGIDPEAIQRALSGDAQSFLSIINQVGQNAFASSVEMSQGLVEHGVRTGTDRFSSSLDSRFKDYELRNKNSSNKALQHPLGQSFMKMVGKQIAAANPQMSAADIHQQAEQMFLKFAEEINAKPEGQKDPNAKPESDWLKYIEEPSS